MRVWTHFVQMQVVKYFILCQIKSKTRSESVYSTDVSPPDISIPDMLVQSCIFLRGLVYNEKCVAYPNLTEKVTC